MFKTITNQVFSVGLFLSRIRTKVVSNLLINSRFAERIVDKIGLSATPMVSEMNLRRYWGMLQPYCNGHELVRVGASGDGGYLLPDDFDGIKYCFSPGAGAIWEFEEALGSRYDIQSFICDGTIENYPSFQTLGSFIPKNVGLIESNNVIAFSSWVESVGNDSGDLLLQMDIEGGEWAILPAIEPDFLNRFRIIVLELHDLHLLTLPSSFLSVYAQSLSNLLKNFDVVHLHPNNSSRTYIAHGIEFPKVVEITLHRKDRSRGLSVARIPHELDSSNNSLIRDFSDYKFLKWASR